MRPRNKRVIWLQTVAVIALLVVSTSCSVKPEGNQSKKETVPAIRPAYPLKMGPNRRYLVDQNDVPFLIVGDSPQALIGDLSIKEATDYLANRQAKGFNALWVNLLCNSYTGCNSDGTTFDGLAPFTTKNDLSTPNEPFFRRVDEVIHLADRYGLVVILNPAETGGWLPALRESGPTKSYNYGRYLGSRYKDFPNIVWMSGNDFQSWNTSGTDNDLVGQLMAGIASADPRHLQTLELNYFRSYSSQDTALAPLLALNAVYSYYETYDAVLAAYNSSPTFPTFLVEGNYEYENLSNFFSGPAGTFILREQQYWAVTSGACGHLWGNKYVWQFKPSRFGLPLLKGWKNSLDSPGALDVAYFNKLFHSFPWWNLVPDQDHQVVTSGYGSYNGSNANLPKANYVTTAWIPDGSLAVIYNPAGSAITVNLARFNQPVTAAWYDPSSGNFTTISGSPMANSGEMKFLPPGKNHDGDSDWVLVFEVKPDFP